MVSCLELSMQSSLWEYKGLFCLYSNYSDLNLRGMCGVLISLPIAAIKSLMKAKEKVYFGSEFKGIVGLERWLSS